VNSLGEDAFMTLLLAQLQNQDPLEPMDDTEFIAQLAQFNSLNQLTQINELLTEWIGSQSLAQSLGYGSSLIGKTVTGLNNDGTEVSGVVNGLNMVDGEVILDVEGEELPLESVDSVWETPEETEE
jgi:flagellar basal-body rod modification protein FlgD